MQKYDELPLDYLGLTKKSIDAYGTIEDTWFKAKDVAELIDYTRDKDGYYDTNTMLRLLNGSEIYPRKFSGDKNRQESYVPENGLYVILCRSNKPLALEAQGYIFNLLKDKRVKALCEQERKNDLLKRLFGENKKAGLVNLVTFEALSKTLGPDWSAFMLHNILKESKDIFPRGKGRRQRWEYYKDDQRGYFEYDDYNNLQLTADGCLYLMEKIAEMKEGERNKQNWLFEC